MMSLGQQEPCYRVKNNLQLISSLLGLCGRVFKGHPDVIRCFAEMRQRLESIHTSWNVVGAEDGRVGILSAARDGEGFSFDVRDGGVGFPAAFSPEAAGHGSRAGTT